jgi:hypothetical protein
MHCRGLSFAVVVRTFIVVVVVAAVEMGCGENRRDIFQRGLEIEHAAEKGPCALQFDEKAKAVSLNGDDIAACLRETERAIVEYDKAAAKGLGSDPEFTRIYEQAKLRRDKLGSMLKQVRLMENEQLVDTR